MKYVALLLCLFTGFAFASPCPASGTLDSYIANGATGCEDSHGTVLHDVTFTSATIAAPDVTLTLALSGSQRVLDFDFTNLDFSLDSFVVSFDYRRLTLAEPMWDFALFNNGVRFFETGGGMSNLGGNDFQQTFHFDAAPTATAIPEPTSIALAFTGAIGLIRRRRN